MKKENQEPKDENIEMQEDEMEAFIKEALKEEGSKKDDKDSSNEGEQDSQQADSGKGNKEIKELNEKYLRLAADFQNYKRRVENEKKEIYSYANESIVCELLNVLDNFERALESMSDKDETLLEGIKMIYKQLSDILSKSGLKEIEAINNEFDPNFHHAVMKEPSDTVQSNKVIDVFQKGYTFNGKVIRPSMVKVSE